MAIPKVRVIVVFANPSGTTQLRLAHEDRAIRHAIERGKARDFISLEVRHAATVDDLRRALLDDEYEILHFSGHGGPGALLFEDVGGDSQGSPLEAIESLVRHHPSIKCVVLNACESVAALKSPIADMTIGMDAAVDDEAAIQFAEGFYDAVAAGKSYEFAVNEGEIACAAKGLTLPLKVLKR
jgi:CHAT domain